MVSSLSVDCEVALILKIDCTLSLPMKRQIVSTDSDSEGRGGGGGGVGGGKKKCNVQFYATPLRCVVQYDNKICRKYFSCKLVTRTVSAVRIQLSLWNTAVI